MSETKIKMEWVNSLPKMTFMDEDAIRDAFIKTNMATRGVNQGAAETFYQKEAMYLKRVIYNSINPSKPKQDLRNSTTFSLYACFMDMALNGDILSFNPDDKLTYVTQRGYKAGRDDQGDIWEQRAKMIISPYGELAIRQDYGQVKYADPVVVVYDGDHMGIETNDQGNIVVMFKSKVPRASKKIIGSFVKVTRPDGSFVMPYFLQEDIDRLAGYSGRQNQGQVNALYGTGENGQGIDAGFLKAKTLKHAFTTFPKVKIKGTNSDLDEQQDDFDDMELPKAQSTDPFKAGYTPPRTQEPDPNGEDFTPGTGKAGMRVERPDEEDTF